MSLKLNIQESSLKKKRGVSFFARKENDQLFFEQASKTYGRATQGQNFNILEEDFRAAEDSKLINLNQKEAPFLINQDSNELQTAINSGSEPATGLHKANIDFLATPGISALPYKSQKQKKSPKEIASAMVKLNSHTQHPSFDLNSAARKPL